MNRGRRQSNLLGDVLWESPDGGAPAARLRLGPAVAVTAIAAVAAVAFGVVPALAHHSSPVSVPRPARQVADVQPLTSPSPTMAVVPSTPRAPAAAPAPAVSTVRSATPAPPAGLVAGPGAACCSTPGGQWTADEDGGAPGFAGPSDWTASTAASFQWSLGSPAGGRGWDQVRVRVWIPNNHARAQVRYTVTSTSAGPPSVRSFDVAQDLSNGWYALPSTFSIGTRTQRTGSLAVALTYLRPAASTTGQCAGCGQMAAAQVQFQWDQ